MEVILIFLSTMSTCSNSVTWLDFLPCLTTLYLLFLTSPTRVVPSTITPITVPTSIADITAIKKKSSPVANLCQHVAPDFAVVEGVVAVYKAMCQLLTSHIRPRLLQLQVKCVTKLRFLRTWVCFTCLLCRSW